MTGTLTFRTAILRVPLVVAMGLALAACQDGQLNLPFLGEGAGTDSAPGTTSTGASEERDVEAPDVFSVTDQGLWDGRPSLGGVWVAHPDVTDPERVIIRNEANGSFVIGALFRRERENPGPTLQVSSDAAEELACWPEHLPRSVLSPCVARPLRLPLPLRQLRPISTPPKPLIRRPRGCNRVVTRSN